MNRIEAGLKKFGGEAFITVLRGTSPAHVGASAKSVEDPLGTITAGGMHAELCEPFIIPQQSKSSARSAGMPLPTIATKGTIALCQPFITKYYGTAKGARPVTEPLGTITAKDHFALVEPTKMDIYFRMLQPHELAAAMGFDAYEFCGTKTDQVKQIGNAVAVRTAEALCGAMLDARQN
jgi:DNA (cytosine-5)-methyltransferase 1